MLVLYLEAEVGLDHGRQTQHLSHVKRVDFGVFHVGLGSLGELYNVLEDFEAIYLLLEARIDLY